MHRGGEQSVDGAVSSQEAVIVLRADRLGFSRQRVATALGISPNGLAAIEQHGELTADPGSLDATGRPRKP